MEEMSLGWCNFELKLSGASQTKKLVTLFVARASSAHANLKQAFTGEGVKEVMAWPPTLKTAKPVRPDAPVTRTCFGTSTSIDSPREALR